MWNTVLHAVRRANRERQSCWKIFQKRNYAHRISRSPPPPTARLTYTAATQPDVCFKSPPQVMAQTETSVSLTLFLKAWSNLLPNLEPHTIRIFSDLTLTTLTEKEYKVCHLYLPFLSTRPSSQSGSHVFTARDDLTGCRQCSLQGNTLHLQS